MINAAQLAFLQATANRTLDLTAKIERDTNPSTVQDGKGHKAESWTVLQVTQPCALAEPTPREMQLYAGEIAGRRAWKVSFAFGTDVQRNDRLTVSGQRMRVQVDETLGSYSTLTQVLATQIV